MLRVEICIGLHEDSDADKDVPIKCQPKEGEEESKAETHETKRRWKITKEDIETYGATPGCLGCRTMKAGLTRQNHNETCRNRIEVEIKKTEEGRARVDRSNTRISQAIANQLERIEKNVTNKQS